MKGLDFLNDYRKLAPIFMGVLLVGSIYGRINDANKDTQTYDEHINAAREYREGKIYATAREEYEKALEMDESLDLYCEIEEMLEEEGNETKIGRWCEKIIEKYPNEPVGYEHIIELYKNSEDYNRCFRQYEIVKKRNINSEKIEDIIASIKYEYDIENRDYSAVSDFVSGYATYVKSDKCGLISSNGENIIDNDYVTMSACDGNYVAVTDENQESYYIDLNGDRRINFPEDKKIVKLGKIFNDLMPVYTNENVYYYSAENGLQKLGPYEDGGTFSHGVAAIKENGKWYLISTDGTKYTEAYDGFFMNDAGEAVFNGRVFAKVENGYLMLNENLEPVNKTVYEEVDAFADDTYAAVKIQGKWGFIDNNGNFVINPKYEKAYSFCNGLAPVFENGLWGFIDTSDKWAVKPLFTNAKPLNSDSCGFVIQQEKSNWDIIKFIEFNY